MYYLDSFSNLATLLSRVAVFVAAVVGIWVAVTRVGVSTRSSRVVVPLAVIFLLSEIAAVLYLILSAAANITGGLRTVTNVAIAGSFLCLSYIISRMSGSLRSMATKNDAERLAEIQDKFNRIHGL